MKRYLPCDRDGSKDGLKVELSVVTIDGVPLGNNFGEDDDGMSLGNNVGEDVVGVEEGFDVSTGAGFNECDRDGNNIFGT